MRVGVATDHGGFVLKQELVAHLREAGHEVVDFGRVHLVRATIIPTSSSRSLGTWPPGRSSAEWRSAVAASGHRCVLTRFRESAPAG
jgi:hypothetical protein